MLGATAIAADVPPPEPRQPADKSPFTLWNPTPRELMRDMSTDRPDKTESPYTVDAGHFQMEADVLSYSYDRYTSDRDHTRVETFAIAPINFKVGLCNSADFQVIVPTYNVVRSRNALTRRVGYDRGFGDLLTRLKVNFWGNDGGKTAFAAMPFVKWPTSSGDIGNNSVEGGVILPFAVALPANWDVVTMLEMDINRDNDGSGHHAEVINTVTFSHNIVGSLSGYVEFFSNLTTEHRGTPWLAMADAGLTYLLRPDVQLDAGINFGVTCAADDFNPFVGISWRF